jgi:hypothetical protein
MIYGLVFGLFCPGGLVLTPVRWAGAGVCGDVGRHAPPCFLRVISQQVDRSHRASAIAILRYNRQRYCQHRAIIGYFGACGRNVQREGVQQHASQQRVISITVVVIRGVGVASAKR